MTPPPPTLAVLLVTYNRLARLRETLPRLLDDPAVSAVLAVNNASTDGTREFLDASASPRLHLVHLDRNTGSSGGFHAGVLHARHHLPHDWLLLQDDDAWPQPGTLAPFLARSVSLPPDIGAVVAAVFRADGEICDMNRPRLFPFLSLRHALRAARGGCRPADFSPTAPPRDIDLGTFVGLAVRRSAVERAPPPDPSWFIYGDDWDYCLTLAKSGFRLRFDPAFRYTHDISSQPTAAHTYTHLWQLYYACRNGFLLQRRHMGRLSAPYGWLRARQWIASTRRYPDPAAALRVIRTAIDDARRGDTSRTLEQVRAL